MFGGDEWELTGSLHVERNGHLLATEVRNHDTGEDGRLAFTLGEGASSINPGNPEEFHAELEPADGEYVLVTHREHTADRCELSTVQLG